jgi:hypothetical protein
MKYAILLLALALLSAAFVPGCQDPCPPCTPCAPCGECPECEVCLPGC